MSAAREGLTERILSVSSPFRRGSFGDRILLEYQRQKVLELSSGLCYNTPTCRVSISAIIVASQASEAGSTPVPCSKKVRPPDGWSFIVAEIHKGSRTHFEVAATSSKTGGNYGVLDSRTLLQKTPGSTWIREFFVNRFADFYFSGRDII